VVWDLFLKLLLKQSQLCNRIFISMLDFKTMLFLFWNCVHVDGYPIFFSPHICMHALISFLLFTSLLGPFFSRPCLSTFLIKKKAVTDIILLRPNIIWPTQEHKRLKKKKHWRKSRNKLTNARSRPNNGHPKSKTCTKYRRNLLGPSHACKCFKRRPCGWSIIRRP